MRRRIILTTAIIAGLLTCGFADHGLWLPALACIGWNIFLLWANTKKKPRAATRSMRKAETKILDFYSTSTTIRTQAKAWTPAGKMIMPVNYEE